MSKQQSDNTDIDEFVRRIQSNLINADTLMEELQRFVPLYANPGRLVGKDTSRLVQLFIQVMATHPEAGNLQTNLLVNIGALLPGNAANRGLFLGQGGVENMLQAMNNSKDHAALHVNCCMMIDSLGADLLAKPKKITRELTKAVLHALRTHAQNENLVNAGLMALDVFLPEVNQATAEEYISVIVKSMQTHIGDRVILSRVCMLLTVLAEGGSSNIETMWKHRVLSAMLASMDVLMSERIPTDPLDLDLRARCLRDFCKVIQKMYTSPNQKEDQGLTVLPRVIVGYIKDDQTVYEACLAISSAAVPNEKNRRCMGADAVRALLLALSCHEYDMSIQSKALTSLFALTYAFEERNTFVKCVSPNVQYVSEENAICVLLKALERHCSNNHMAGRVCALLTEVALCRGYATKQAALKHESIRLIARAMNHQAGKPGEDETLRFGSCALSNILQECMSDFADPASKREFKVRMVKQEAVSAAALAGLTTLVGCRSTLYENAKTLYILMLGCPDNIEAFGLRSIRPLANAVVAFGVQRKAESVPILALWTTSSALMCIMQHASQGENYRKYQDRFGQSGGIQAMLLCLKLRCVDGYDAIIQDQNMQEFKNICTETMFEATCTALWLALDAHPENQKLACRDGAIIECVLKIMNKYRECRETQRAGCIALSGITLQNIKGAHMVLKRGGLEAVAHAERTREPRTEGLDEDPFITCLLQDLKIFSTMPYTEEELEYPANSKDSRGKSAGGNEQKGKPATEVCSACGQSAAVGGPKLFKCSACTVAPLYCCIECQRACWKSHKAECKANRKAAK
jgi:hypothetical protein